MADKDRHIELAPKDLKLLNPNTRTCPIFRSPRDAELTKTIYRRIPILVDHRRKKGGNPWGIKFLTMFHQTNDAELFHAAEDLAKEGFKRDGAVWKKGKQLLLPLYESKMIEAYDHRFASVFTKETNWLNQGQTNLTTSVEHQNTELTAEPRWWVPLPSVVSALGEPLPPYLVAYRDVTNATNRRTMIATFLPCYGVVNTAALIRFASGINPEKESCLLANLNSHAYGKSVV